jgi:AraC family transcriptional regulator
MLPSDQDHAYHGKCLRRRHIAGLIFSERSYGASLEIPPHSHEHPFLCAILQGASSERCGTETWDCTANAVFVRPAGLTHANRVGEMGLRFLGIELAPDWPARWDKRALLPKCTVTVDGVCPGLTRKLYREFRADDAASALVLEGLVLEILGEACRAVSVAETGLPLWLRRTRELLHVRYRERPSLMELASEAGVHPFHLARAFRRSFGCTVGEYVRRLRIECACHALAIPGSSLVRVALEAGFADQSQFSRTFKQIVGITPSEYRRNVLGR